jgi:AraC family transcriptional regulator
MTNTKTTYSSHGAAVALQKTVPHKTVFSIANAAAAVRVPVVRDEHGLGSDLSGATLAERRVPGFRVIEIKYAGGTELPLHSHRNAHLIYVLEGSYSESYASSASVVCQAGSFRYLPPNQKHADVFKESTRCLVIEIEPESLARVQKDSKVLERPGEIRSVVSAWLAQRLYHEFQQGDSVSPLSMEGILWEILADAARNAGASGPVRVVPRWLRVAREYLESNFLRPLSLAEVAAVASVHRVHLSREFRRHYSTTVGEFLRRKRVEHACHLVSQTNDPLADVAMTCGFSDQSHFSATFRRQVGLTPGRFRQMAQSS